MRQYIPPLLWLSLATLSVVSSLAASRPHYLKSLAPERQASLRNAYASRFAPFAIAAAGAFCFYGAVRGVLTGSPTWWLWILAAAGQAVGWAVHRRTALRIGAQPSPPTAAQRRRERRVLLLIAGATACFLAAQPVARLGADEDNGSLTAIAVALMFAALVGYIAAGWAAVWAPTREDPKQGASSTG